MRSAVTIAARCRLHFSPRNRLSKNGVRIAFRTCLVLSGIVQRGTVKISVIYLN